MLEAATLGARGCYPSSEGMAPILLTHSLTHLTDWLSCLLTHGQASSGLASEEMAEMVSANHDALAASQQHVLELEHNMTVMIEQQVSGTRVGSST